MFTSPRGYSEVIEKLRDAVSQKNFMKWRRDFATSLISQFDRWGKLSDKQIEWVFKLIEEYDQLDSTTGSMAPKKKDYPHRQLDDPTRLFDLFTKAREKHVKFPKIRIQVGNETLHMWHSARLNVINISESRTNDEGRHAWLAGLKPDGELKYADRLKNLDELCAVLNAFSANPSEAGKVIGQKMRWCCFCSRKLTTTDSIYYGYGPICAENFGLEWGEARTHIKVEAIEDEIAGIGELKI